MLKYVLQYYYFSFNLYRNICLLISLSFLMSGCLFTTNRATLCSYLFNRRHKEISFDENCSIGFYATNGYWQLDLKRLVSNDSVYKITLVDYYSHPFEFTLQSLYKCMQESCYPGCTRKGLFKAISIQESKQIFKKRVNFSCETLMFDSEASLINFINAPWQNSRTRKLLSPEGVFICIDSFRNDTILDVIVEVAQLTVNGKSPSFKTLEPYVNGIFRWHSHHTESDINNFFINIQNLDY